MGHGASSTRSKLMQLPKSNSDKTSLPRSSTPGRDALNTPNRNLTQCSNGKAPPKIFQLKYPSVSTSDRAALGCILPDCATCEAISEVLECEGSFFPEPRRGESCLGSLVSVLPLTPDQPKLTEQVVGSLKGVLMSH